MARPRSDQPTPAELEILKILWDRGSSTVREVMEVLQRRNHQRAYTSVMSLMNVMVDKGLLVREPQGRAFRYQAEYPREQTLGNLVSDLVDRAFEGSASTLVAHLLEKSNPTHDELDEIRRAIESFREQQEPE